MTTRIGLRNIKNDAKKVEVAKRRVNSPQRDAGGKKLMGLGFWAAADFLGVTPEVDNKK